MKKDKKQPLSELELHMKKMEEWNKRRTANQKKPMTTLINNVPINNFTHPKIKNETRN